MSPTKPDLRVIAAAMVKAGHDARFVASALEVSEQNPDAAEFMYLWMEVARLPEVRSEIRKMALFGLQTFVEPWERAQKRGKLIAEKPAAKKKSVTKTPAGKKPAARKKDGAPKRSSR